jgi:hypothetical protein
LLDPARVLQQQQLLHLLGLPLLGDHPDEVSDRAHRCHAPLAARRCTHHCRGAPPANPGAFAILTCPVAAVQIIPFGAHGERHANEQTTVQNEGG